MAKNYHTFKGTFYRIQLWISDQTGENIPEEFRKQDVSFFVFALPANAHPSTPFSSGRAIYHGNEFPEAWRLTNKHVKVESVPSKFRKYL